MYNFMNIEPIEFEEICKEILEKVTNQSFRVFGKGKDGGIDIQSNENERIIGQAKLYINSTQDVVVRAVKKELDKIKKDEVEQYYLFIGREMSPQNVQVIYNEFKSYMKTKENIYTLKEINELLEKEEFIDIVRNHTKLWMNSANILEIVQNRNIFFDSEILFNDIKRDLTLFVETDNYHNCKKILEEKRNLLILGAPGVGKTTISKMLTLYFAQKGYTIRHTDAQNIDELKKSISLDYNKKEFIFLDDCLGQSYLELHEKTENDLIRFIKYIKNNPNKILLLNSRITVFKEATTRKYELEKVSKNQDFCIEIMNVEKMTDLEKAKILDRHLQVNKVPEEYKSEIRKNTNYMKIIKNASYNPRMIDYITDKHRYLEISPKDYVSEILKAFEKSEYVWEDEFKYRIDRQDRILLYTLYSISSHHVKENVLKKAFLKRMKLEKIDTTNCFYEDVLKRLNESFIKVIIKNNERLISVINPSVNDFLKHKLEENFSEVEKLLKSIKVIEQCDRLLKDNQEEKEFIKNFLKDGNFLKLMTNEYNTIEDLYLAYIVECEMQEKIEIVNIINKIEDLQGNFTVIGDYLSKLDIIIKFYQCKKYEKSIKKFILDGTNLIYLMNGMDLVEKIELLKIVFDDTNEEKIKNKDSIVEYIKRELKQEIYYFSRDILETEIDFDDIVASEIEELKIEFEDEHRNLLSPNFKRKLLQRVKKSFRQVCIDYIDDTISNIYIESPEYIYYNIGWIDTEEYINEDMIRDLSRYYIELVFNTPEEDYSYYKKYLFEKYEINITKEEMEIHKIFNKNTELSIL